ncbi:hypothetical protein WR25_07424 [Diploscapter pachys]|uniref:Calmodulin-binding domain-containing protein n=1 Tax=Diploscapter pachys TaxID=2018661 RepID=A0A2A2KXQ3_9BILA|nr:hypothetical protein WR25_07424 [Diploscapter pachys]
MDRPYCFVQAAFGLQPLRVMNSPVRERERSSLTGQSVDTASFRRFLNDKRKNYRNRSLGPTIASAPSVEQEDYRTPRPSFDKTAGKSFDLSASHHGPTTSDSNGLIKVSTDFLRLNGSRQQFRNLLSARKKMGSLPPAYTRIDYSRESLDSNRGGHHGPVITVEDTGSQLKINHIRSNPTERLIESQKNSFEKGTGTMKWSFIESSRSIHATHSGRTFDVREVPVDVLLSMLMLCRSYLFARFMVLHSKQFQDASTRTLAALNRIQVNFSFVMKTVLDQRPLLFLTTFTIIFWLFMSWAFVTLERFGLEDQDAPSIMYSNALWFIAITFMLNGYGDVVPQTNAGRILAIFVGVMGAIISSILIAVISRNILLSQGQRNVNNFMYDSKLTREHKHAAARVLQHTWKIHVYLKAGEGFDGRLRAQQRKFLRAIHAFRSIKNEMRVFSESNSVNAQQVTRLVAEMHSSMQKLVAAQEEMRAQIEVLQRAVRNHYAHAHGANTPTQSDVLWEEPASTALIPTGSPQHTQHIQHSHQVTVARK